jgi:hypothetical protein
MVYLPFGQAYEALDVSYGLLDSSHSAPIQERELLSNVNRCGSPASATMQHGRGSPDFAIEAGVRAGERGPASGKFWCG